MSKAFSFIRDFLTKNLRYKLFSVVVALIGWFLVMNTINPVEIQSYSATVSVADAASLAEKGYVVTDIDKLANARVSVRVSGTRPGLDELRKPENKSRIHAVVNASSIDIDPNDTFPKQYTVAVTPQLPGGIYVYSYQIESYYPASVTITVDRLKTVTKTLEVSSDGKVEGDYLVNAPVCDVSEVSVSGPSSALGRIANVKAVIDIKDATTTVNSSVPVVAYDADGKEIAELTFEPSVIDVMVPIYKRGTVKVNTPSVKGELPPNIKLKGLTVEPNVISVLGDEQTIDSVDAITPDEVDLSSVTVDNTVISIDCTQKLKDEGLRPEAIDGAVIDVTVNIELENAHSIDISKEAISISGLKEGLNATIESESVSIELGGAPEPVAVSALSPTIDLTALEEGEYELPLLLTIPEGYGVRNNAKVKVNIVSEVQEQSTEETTEEMSETESEPETEETTE